MLKKESKLGSIDLKKLKKEGKRVYSTLFSVTFLPQTVSKFSVTVSKKLYKSAVLRNKAKRRVFAILKDLTPKSNGFYDFFLKSQIDKVNFTDLAEEVKKILCQK